MLKHFKKTWKAQHAWVVCIKDVSVTILSPRRIDSTRSKWMSMEEMGTADTSTVNSPLTGSNKEHRVEILPVIRKPPVQPKIFSLESMWLLITTFWRVRGCINENLNEWQLKYHMIQSFMVIWIRNQKFLASRIKLELDGGHGTDWIKNKPDFSTGSKGCLWVSWVM